MNGKKLDSGVKALLHVITINKERTDKNKLILFYPFKAWTRPYENYRSNWPPILDAYNVKMLLDVMEYNESKVEALKIISYVITTNENELLDILEYINDMTEPYRSEALTILNN